MVGHTHADRQDAADLLQRVVDAVAAGELDAESSQARRLLRRIEGAVEGLRAE